MRKSLIIDFYVDILTCNSPGGTNNITEAHTPNGIINNNYTCVFFLLWHVEITCQTPVSVPASPRYTLAWVSIHFTFLFIWSSVFEGGSETMLRKEFIRQREQSFSIFILHLIHYSYRYHHKPLLQSHSCLQILLFLMEKFLLPQKEVKEWMLSVPSMGHYCQDSFLHRKWSKF